MLWDIPVPTSGGTNMAQTTEHAQTRKSSTRFIFLCKKWLPTAVIHIWIGRSLMRRGLSKLIRLKVGSVRIYGLIAYFWYLWVVLVVNTRCMLLILVEKPTESIERGFFPWLDVDTKDEVGPDTDSDTEEVSSTIRTPTFELTITLPITLPTSTTAHHL